MAMLRHKRRTTPGSTMRLVYSVRTVEDVIYADELDGDALLTYTREAPDGWTGHTGRIDADLVATTGISSGTAFVCGSNAFVEAATELLVDVGFDAGAIRTERFGPTG